MAANGYKSELYYEPDFSLLDQLTQQRFYNANGAPPPQQGGGLGDSLGSMAGQYAGREATNYAANQIGSSGAAQSGLGAIGGNFASMGIGPQAGIIAGAILTAKGAKDLYEDNKTKGLTGWGGRAQLGIATGGLSEVARALGVFGHKSTRDVAKGHTNSLMSQSPEDSKWQSYVSGMRDQFNSAPPDPSKPFAGKYGSWDEYKKAGLDAADLTGVYGNLKAYGPQYAGLTFDQQKALTQKNIDAGNYSSKKGEVVINDEAKAKSFLDELLKAKK